MSAPTVKEILVVLDTYRLSAAAIECDGGVVVTWPNVGTPSERSLATKRIAEALTDAGYECSRSRTRVVVWRKGTRKVLGPPSVVCRRGGAL